MERLRKSLPVVLLFALLVIIPGNVRAIVGQLNNGFAEPSPQTVVTTIGPDALQECNQKYAQMKQALANCQKAAAVETKVDNENDQSEHLYLYWAIGSTVIAAILGVVLAATSLKKKPQPSAQKPTIPPFTA